MRHGTRFVVVAVAALASGCGINVHLPASRLETPETYGRAGAFGVDLGTQGSNSLGLTPDYTSTPVDTSNPSYDRDVADPKFGASVGLAERFDLGVKTAWDSPFLLQGKYQLLGDPQRTAKQGNSSLAVTAGIGNHVQGGSSESSFGNGYDAYEMTAYLADGSIIAGYRFSNHGVIFGGPFVQKYWISGTHTLDDAPEVAYNLDAHQYGVNLAAGLSLSSHFQLMLEVVLAESRANDSHIRSAFVGGHLALVRF